MVKIASRHFTLNTINKFNKKKFVLYTQTRIILRYISPANVECNGIRIKENPIAVVHNKGEKEWDTK